MGNLFTRSVKPDSTFYYSLSFSFYITSIEANVVSPHMLNEALKKCGSSDYWRKNLSKIFKTNATNIVINVTNVSDFIYNGKITWECPIGDISELNSELKVSCPTGIHTMQGKGWIGISFFDIVKEGSFVVI